MIVDFKVSQWDRIVIPTGYEEKARALLLSGDIMTTGDLMRKLDIDCEVNSVDGTQEQMISSDIDGARTIEAFENEDNGSPFYKNGK